MRFTAVQCDWRGFSQYCDSFATANPMSGRVHIIRCIRLPMAGRYSTLDGRDGSGALAFLELGCSIRVSIGFDYVIWKSSKSYQCRSFGKGIGSFPCGAALPPCRETLWLAWIEIWSLWALTCHVQQWGVRQRRELKLRWYRYSDKCRDMTHKESSWSQA